MLKGAPWRLVSIGIFLILCTACGKKEPAKSARQPTPLDLSTTGTISGQVRFKDPMPEQTVLQLNNWSEYTAQHHEGNPRAEDVRITLPP